MDFARALWLRLETIHAVTYFAPEPAQAATDAGLSGFWMGYFGFRAAPMGPVAAGVVEGTFFNFAPSFIARWVPEVWQRATPEQLLAARGASSVLALRHHPQQLDLALAAAPALAAAVARATAAGRPLFATNRSLAPAADPHEALWQLCTTLREHRGDGHVAALTAAGLDGLQALVLISLDQGSAPGDLQRARGWTADEWASAVDQLTSRGLVDASGALTDAGRALRAEVESITDRLAAAPFSDLDDERDELIAHLDPLARAISQSGVIRYPNPMGLPPLV